MNCPLIYSYVDIPCYELYLPGLREKLAYAEFDAAKWGTELEGVAGGERHLKGDYGLRFVVRQDRKTVKTEIARGVTRL